MRSYQITKLTRNYDRGVVRFECKEIEQPIFAYFRHVPPGMNVGWLVDFVVHGKKRRYDQGGGVTLWAGDKLTPIEVIAKTTYSVELEQQQQEDDTVPDLSGFVDSNEFLGPEHTGMVENQIYTLYLTTQAEPFQFEQDSGQVQRGIKVWLKNQQGEVYEQPYKLTAKRFKTISTAYGPNSDFWDNQPIMVKVDKFQGTPYIDLVGTPPGATAAAPATQQPAPAIAPQPVQNAPQAPQAAPPVSAPLPAAAAPVAAPVAPAAPVVAPAASETTHTDLDDSIDSDIPF